VLEQALLAQSAGLREAIMGLMDRAIEGIVVDEAFEIIEIDNSWRQKIPRDPDVFRMR
jgi:hypothetical protein